MSENIEQIQNIFCPFERVCTWSGNNDALQSHFQEAHPLSVVQTPYFSLLTYEVQQVYLFPFNDKTFLLNVRWETVYKAKQKVLYAVLSLQLLGTDEEAQELVYFVDLMNAGERIKRFSCQDIDIPGNEIHFLKFAVQRTHVTKAMITQTPKVSKRFIVFLSEQLFFNDRKISHFKLEITPNRNKHLRKLNDVIQERPECPTCMETMEAPINHCPNGHLLCNNCTSQVKLCPTCRNPGKLVRNLFAEEVCPVKYLGANCKWNGMISNILDHLHAVHQDNVLEIRDVLIPLSENSFEDYGEVFRLLYKYEKKVFYWTVQLAGPSCDDKCFEFALTVISENERKCKFTMTYACTGYTDDVTSNAWFSCPLNIIRPFVDENMNLVYRIEIVKK